MSLENFYLFICDYVCVWRCELATVYTQRSQDTLGCQPSPSTLVETDVCCCLLLWLQATWPVGFWEPLLPLLPILLRRAESTHTCLILGIQTQVVEPSHLLADPTPQFSLGNSKQVNEITYFILKTPSGSWLGCRLARAECNLPAWELKQKGQEFEASLSQNKHK